MQLVRYYTLEESRYSRAGVKKPDERSNLGNAAIYIVSVYLSNYSKPVKDSVCVRATFQALVNKAGIDLNEILCYSFSSVTEYNAYSRLMCIGTSSPGHLT